MSTGQHGTMNVVQTQGATPKGNKRRRKKHTDTIARYFYKAYFYYLIIITIFLHTINSIFTVIYS
jgi:hypothetical protein